MSTPAGNWVNGSLVLDRRVLGATGRLDPR
jgi:hypothetical protein